MPLSPERKKLYEEEWNLLINELLMPSADRCLKLKRFRVHSCREFLVFCRNKVFSTSDHLPSFSNPCFLELVLLFEQWLDGKDIGYYPPVLPSPAEVGLEFLQVRNQALKMKELVCLISSLPCFDGSSLAPEVQSLPVLDQQKLPDPLCLKSAINIS